MDFSNGFGNGFGTGVYDSLVSPVQAMEFPELLTYTDSRPHILSADESFAVFGVDGKGEAVGVDLDDESPHILVNAGTGGGKSVIARTILSQQVRKGSLGVVLDIKRHSHKWAQNNPSIGYAKTLPEIGNALVELGRELHRRNEIVDLHDGPNETAPIGRRVIVVMEEMNATLTQLRDLSRRLPKGSYTALDAYFDLMLMGRAVKMHVVAVTQYADARVMGGVAMRENFGLRILAKYQKPSWTLLAWDAGLPLPCPPERGRGYSVNGGKAVQTQYLFLTEAEAATLASGGDPVALAPSVLPQIGQ